MGDKVTEKEAVELVEAEGPVFTFDAPNADTDGAVVANLRFGVAKSIESLMFDLTKLYTHPGNTYARIAFMLSDPKVGSFVKNIKQLEGYYSRPLYREEWLTKKLQPFQGLKPGTVFRTRFEKDLAQLREKDETKDVNRTPAAALNSVLGCEYFRSLLDLIFSNREAPEQDSGFIAVAKYIVDGGVSCLGLEMGSRFPYLNASGALDEVCIRRSSKLVPASQLRLMGDPLLFNMLCASYLQCQSGLLRVDYVDFFVPGHLRSPCGRIRS